MSGADTIADVVCVLDVQARLGECPRWDERRGLLYWVDINNFRLNEFDPATGENKFLQLDEEIGCFALREKGGFVAGLRSGLYLIDSLQGGLTKIAAPEADKPKNRYNDGRCDAQGRFWAGSMTEGRAAQDGWLWRLDPDHRVERMTGEVYTSNGCAFSPDNKTLYYSDTPNHVIYAFDFDLASGEISNKRVFHQFPIGHGRPDGAAVDSEGCYWAGMYAGSRVVRLSPQGEILAEIPVPAKNVTMVAFGGADLQTVYVTTARDGSSEEDLAKYPQSGGIFAFRAPVPGLAEHRFGG